MSKNFNVKFILHFNIKPTNNIYLSLFRKKQLINDKYIINFEVPLDKFSDFQIFLPAKLNIINQNGTIIKDYTLNLLKGNNTYHLFDGCVYALYELIFYNEDEIKISVGDVEITDYDQCSKFKRFGLININNRIIKINNIEINLEYFEPDISGNANSFQFSFYNITKKYIVSKIIQIPQKKSIFNYYENEYHTLSQFSQKLINLKQEIKINKNETLFNEKYGLLFNNYIYYFKKMKELNLILPKKYLQNIINDDKYVTLFYYITQLMIFYIFSTCNDKNVYNFCKIFDYIEVIYNQLLKDKLERFETISILMNLKVLFDKLRSCEKFINIKFHYIKIAEIKKNTIMDLSLKFLNDYIDNLNEESPSFLNLVEINSGYGYFKNEKMFIFDMIGLSDLKAHLKEMIPSIICFYTLKDIDNNAMTNLITGGVFINEAKLYECYETIGLNEEIPKGKENESKNIAMKLSEDLMHECFGHKKFKSQPILYESSKIDTPFKCIKKGKIKKLVSFKTQKKKNRINILYSNERSDSGNFFESSFDKLKNTQYYTFTYLKNIKDKGKLIDNPHLFYDINKLDKLQKYVYYKWLFEKENKNKEIDLEKISFEEEFNYLLKKYEDNEDKKDLSSNIKNSSEAPEEIESEDKKSDNKFLHKKRKAKDKNESTNNKIRIRYNFNSNKKKKKKKKKKFPILLNEVEIKKKLFGGPLTTEEFEYYNKLYSETQYKI